MAQEHGVAEHSTSVVSVKRIGRAVEFGEWRTEPKPTLWVNNRLVSPTLVEWVDGEREVLEQIARAGFPILDENEEPQHGDGTSPRTNRGYGRVRRVVAILGAVVLFCWGFSLISDGGWPRVLAGVTLIYMACSIVATGYELEHEIEQLRLVENHRWLDGE